MFRQSLLFRIRDVYLPGGTKTDVMQVTPHNNSDDMSDARLPKY